jgi:flagellar biosynthesis/type III secretory pathway M-ring protein FliF/YscJ
MQPLQRESCRLTWALVLGALLALLVVAFVARPFLREPAPRSDHLDELGVEERRRLQLVEERDRALAALKELEFDHRTGKVTDADYREQLGPMRRRAAEALKALDTRAEDPDEHPARR